MAFWMIGRIELLIYMFHSHSKSGVLKQLSGVRGKQSTSTKLNSGCFSKVF